MLTAIGAASPAACAIIGPIALGFAGRYRINPLMMGMFVVHGAQAGGFSPISIYGDDHQLRDGENGLPVSEIAVFLASLVVNLAIAVRAVPRPRRTRLIARRIDDGRPGRARPAHRVGVDRGGGTATVGAGHAADGGGTATASPPAPRADPRGRATTRSSRWSRSSAVARGRAGLRQEHRLRRDHRGGHPARCLTRRQQKGAVKQIAWPTVLLVAGVSTFAAILNDRGRAGVRRQRGPPGSAPSLLGALMLCYVGGVVSAFASSTALLPVIIPIAIPLIADGEHQRRRPRRRPRGRPRRSSTSARSPPTAR